MSAGVVSLTAAEYLTRFGLPNFYFHVTTATLFSGQRVSSASATTWAYVLSLMSWPLRRTPRSPG